MEASDAAETAKDRTLRGVRARRRLLGVLLALAVAIGVVVSVAIATSQAIVDSSAAFVDEAFPLRGEVDDLELAMVNQQTAVRGYILTGSESRLATYGSGRASAAESLAEISSRSVGHPEIVALLDRASPEIAALDAYFASQIDHVSNGRMAAARNDLATGETLFNRFRRTAALMVQETDALIREARADQEDRADDLAVILALIGVVAVALAVGLAFIVPRRAARLLDQLEAESDAATRAADSIARLQDLTAALAAASTTPEVAAAVLETGQRATGASAGSIAILSPERDSLVTIAMTGYDEEMRKALAAYPLDAALPLAEAIRGGAVWLTDGRSARERYPRLANLRQTSNHEAVAALPLVVDGRVIGGLSLRFAEARRFPRAEQEYLTAIAGLCAQALDRARLFESERRDAERESFLSEASVLLAATLEPRATLAELARLAVPHLADWCIVTTGTGRTLETVAVAHRDPAKTAAATELAARRPPQWDAPHGAGAVMRTGRSEFLPDLTEEMVDATVPPGGDRDLIRSLGLTSAMSVPLTARGRVLGALTLVRAESGRRFDRDDLRFAEDFGVRAGLAMDNAMLFTRSRTIARTLQESLLPAVLPEIDGLEVAARYIAAGDGVEVGGDFYDLFELDEDGGADGRGWAAVLGDVCGKGPEAAALTALARHTIRAEADLLEPSRVLGRLNRAILRQRGDLRFLTATYVWLRHDGPGLTAVAARGGHPPLVVLRADGSVETMAPRGMLIGALPDAGWDDHRFALGAGDALVLYSDGVVEARAPGGDFFGMDRLLALLTRSRGATAEDIAVALEREIGRFQGGRQRDDIALLVLRVVARGGGRSGGARSG